ncbi:Tyrosine phosphatase family, putative [Leishmania lindenbergi]|uniref:Tyrosine phosphatase family n=1 Tax=Leishmania lindenbergi TaxID=651832 RepID=A0AAW3AUI9_9TRYP
MSSPPLQQHSMWTRRGNNKHDPAAALFEEMNHAARTGSCAGALQASLPVAAPLTHVQHLRGGRYGSAIADASTSQPSFSTGLSLQAATTATTASLPSSGHRSLPLVLPAPLFPTSSAAAPYFYVRPLGSRQAAVGQHHVNRQSRGGSDLVVATQTTHAWGPLTPSSACSSPSSRCNSLPGFANAVHCGAPLNVESGTGHNSPASPSALSQSFGVPTGLGNGVGSGAQGGSHLVTPTATRGTSAAAAAAPVAAPVYVWHNSSSMAGAAPWLRLRRPAGVAAAPATSPCASATCVGGRRGSAAGSGVRTPQNPGSSGAGMLALPPHPSNLLALPEHAHFSTVFGAADEDTTQQSPRLSLTGKDAGGGSVPAMTRAHSYSHQQQQLLSDLLSGVGGASCTLSAPLPLTLVPPLRFARVEAGVYRGAYPVLRNFPYIRRLRLRTIVSLIPEPPTYDLKCFAEAEHIQLHHIQAERAKGEVQLLPSELSEALQLIINKEMHPLYIHCLDGRYVTGLVIMVLRKLLQWDAKVAHAEFQRFTREVQDEVAFIADYTGPLLVPPHLPAWLWGGSLYDAATGQQKRLPSTIRLRLATAVSSGAAATAGGVDAAPGAGLGRVSVSPSGGASSAVGAGPVNSPLGATSAAVSHNPKGTMRGTSGDLRPQAAAPWMHVPQAELVAADGQHYIDVERLPVAQAASGSPPGAAGPMWISLMEPSSIPSTGPASGCGSRCQGTASGDALLQHQRRLPSSSNSNTTPSKGPSASGLLEGRVSALLWTSGAVATSAAVGGSGGIPGGGRVSGSSAGSSGGSSAAAGSSANSGGGAMMGVSGPAATSPSSAARAPKRSHSC